MTILPDKKAALDESYRPAQAEVDRCRGELARAQSAPHHAEQNLARVTREYEAAVAYHGKGGAPTGQP